MSAKTIGAVAAVAWVVIVLMSSFYQIHETETVIITQFGRPVGTPVTEPGFRFKVPFLQVVNRFDKRLLEWDGSANEVPTRDKEFITADTYALWRISDPLRFYQRVRDDRGADNRLDDIIDGETRNAIATHDLVDLVRGSSQEVLAREILARVSERVQDFGIEVLDLRFKRINYIEEVREDVIARMILGNRQRALGIYEEALDFLRTDAIDDTEQQVPIGDLLTTIEGLNQELGR